MPKFNPHDRVDTRDYATEARNMVKPLAKNQCYELYEIVLHKLQRVPQGSTKEKEYEAVKEALEARKDLDYYVMLKHRKGYGNMANGARAKDGNTEKHKKRV